MVEMKAASRAAQTGESTAEPMVDLMAEKRDACSVDVSAERTADHWDALRAEQMDP